MDICIYREGDEEQPAIFRVSGQVAGREAKVLPGTLRHAPRAEVELDVGRCFNLFHSPRIQFLNREFLLIKIFAADYTPSQAQWDGN